MSYKEAIDWHHNSCYSQRSKNWLLPNDRLFLMTFIVAILYLISILKRLQIQWNIYVKWTKCKKSLRHEVIAWNHVLVRHKIHNSPILSQKMYFSKFFCEIWASKGSRRKMLLFHLEMTFYTNGHFYQYRKMVYISSW